MIITTPAGKPIDPELWQQLQDAIAATHKNGIRAKSAVKRQTECADEAKALFDQINQGATK